ncbi:hypothetical protein GE09DRAFT_1222855 [Coniochaeta sp. 2T2.1]|nr:hypothetical protein GE09DRAFT_1222855 [Coniochaeta sp. 2T2.1]
MALPYRSGPAIAGTFGQHHDNPDTTTGPRPIPGEGMWIEGVPFPIPARQSARRPRYSMLKYGGWVDMDRRPSVVDYFSRYASHHDDSTATTESRAGQDIGNQVDTAKYGLAPQPATNVGLAASHKPSSRQYLHVEHTSGGFIRLYFDCTTSGATRTRLLLPDRDILHPAYYELGEVPGTNSITPTVGDMIVERTLVNLKFFVDAYQAMKLRKHTLIQEWKRRHPDAVDLVLRQRYEVAAELNHQANQLAELELNPRLKIRYVTFWDPVRRRAETESPIYLKVQAVRGVELERDYSFGDETELRYLVTGEEAVVAGHFDLVLPETEDVYRRLCSVVAGFTPEDWRSAVEPDIDAETGEDDSMDEEGDWNQGSDAYEPMEA